MIGMKMTTFSNRLKNTDREGNYIYIYLEIKDNARNKPKKKKNCNIFTIWNSYTFTCLNASHASLFKLFL